MKEGGVVIGRREIKSRRRRDGLIQYAKNNTSQNGEDGIIDRIFHILPDNSNGERLVCVDVGAWDGVHLSNTFSLLVPNGTQNSKWRGILIEADVQRFQDLKKLHEPLGNTCVCIEVSCIPDSSKSLSHILRHQSPKIPQNFDFLCIDVDGPDYWLLHDVFNNGEYAPKLICIEFNPSMPDDLIYIQERSDTVRHGSSLSALYQLATDNDYTLIETTLFNAFFLQTSLYMKYFKEQIPEPSIEALHESTMSTSLYQLYDGTLKISGCKKLLWHRLPIDEKKIQILPEKRRTFPFAPSLSSTSPKVSVISEKESNEIRSKAIDMSSYCMNGSTELNGSIEEAKRECALKLFDQFQSDGFAFISGTGFTSDIAENGLLATKSFLQDADESVRRSALTKDRARRGYSPMNTENFASLIGDIGHNDLVRKFRIGPLNPPIAMNPDENYTDDRKSAPDFSNEKNESKSSPLLSPNIWPKGGIHWDSSHEESFQKNIEKYYESSCKIANDVVQAICDGIIHHNKSTEQSLKVFHSNMNAVTNTSILTLLGYRTGSRHKGKLNRPLVASHTDVGVITLLLFDGGDCAKLQRKASENDGNTDKWVDVNLPSTIGDNPVFVVNIGDCLSDLSDNALPSTLHRVMPLAGKESRNCLALFVGLDPDTQLTLPSGECMTFEEWRRRRIARATNVLKSKSKH